MKLIKWYVLCFLMIYMVACGNDEVGNSDNYTVKIINVTSEDIYGIGYTYYVNEKVTNSGGICNADNSAIKNGDDVVLDNIPDVETFVLEISVTDGDGRTYPCVSKVNINSGEQYLLQIAGDFEAGFEIEIVMNEM